jgi:poly [ADP-ribose] polymerase 2/3/4
MGRIIKLIMTTADNHNKFYDMVENDDGTFSAFWGRVDVTKTETRYPISKWDSQYNSKVKKGYVDVTHLRTETVAKHGFLDISDPKIASIVNELQSYANTSVKNNYTVSAEQVTKKQIDTAQDIVNDLTPIIIMGGRTQLINDKLLELYRTIPRKMKKVQLFLFDFSKIASQEQFDSVNRRISDEQDLLDVLRGQVKVNTVLQETTDARTILDAMGLSFTLPSEDDIRVVKKMLGQNSRQFKRAFCVKNNKTQARFDKHMQTAKNKTQRYLWHGSRNENWWSIIENGLVLNPASAIKTGAMFGKGLYFADLARKSLGYTSLSGSYWARGSSHLGMLSLYDVHLGYYLKIKHHEGWCSSLTKDRLTSRGEYDSLFAEGGADLRNNEYIVYDERQCTIRYLVEVTG